MTEREAREAGLVVRAATLQAGEIDWFRSRSATDGFVKVVAEEGTGRLLGAHFIRDRVSTLIGEAALAVQHRLTAARVASTVHPYPTASELFRWACSQLT